MVGSGWMPVESKDSLPSIKHKAWERKVEPQGPLLSIGRVFGNGG